MVAITYKSNSFERLVKPKREVRATVPELDKWEIFIQWSPDRESFGYGISRGGFHLFRDMVYREDTGDFPLNDEEAVKFAQWRIKLFLASVVDNLPRMRIMEIPM